jgi:hypothetical protein
LSKSLPNFHRFCEVGLTTSDKHDAKFIEESLFLNTAETSLLLLKTMQANIYASIIFEKPWCGNMAVLDIGSIKKKTLV